MFITTCWNIFMMSTLKYLSGNSNIFVISVLATTNGLFHLRFSYDKWLSIETWTFGCIMLWDSRSYLNLPFLVSFLWQNSGRGKRGATSAGLGENQVLIQSLLMTEGQGRVIDIEGVNESSCSTINSADNILDGGVEVPHYYYFCSNTIPQMSSRFFYAGGSEIPDSLLSLPWYHESWGRGRWGSRRLCWYRWG